MSRSRLKQMFDVVMCGDEALFSVCVDYVIQWMVYRYVLRLEKR